MNAPALDERKHVEVVKAALTATVGADRVYEYGKVPGETGNTGTLPPIFVLPAIERTYVEPERNGRTGRSAWRLTIRYVGRTASEARWAGLQIAEALEQKRLTIDGHTSTPLKFEPTDGVAPDGSRSSGIASYTYVL